MPRIIVAVLAIVVATTAGAQETGAELEPERSIGAAAYIRGLLDDDRYDPRDRERALNGARQLDQHWRSTIFDGRRTRATRGTGLRLPVIPDQPRPAAE